MKFLRSYAKTGRRNSLRRLRHGFCGLFTPDRQTLAKVSTDCLVTFVQQCGVPLFLKKGRWFDGSRFYTEVEIRELAVSFVGHQPFIYDTPVLFKRHGSSHYKIDKSWRKFVIEDWRNFSCAVINMPGLRALVVNESHGNFGVFRNAVAALEPTFTEPGVYRAVCTPEGRITAIHEALWTTEDVSTLPFNDRRAMVEEKFANSFGLTKENPEAKTDFIAFDPSSPATVWSGVILISGRMTPKVVANRRKFKAVFDEQAELRPLTRGWVKDPQPFKFQEVLYEKFRPWRAVEVLHSKKFEYGDAKYASEYAYERKFGENCYGRIKEQIDRRVSKNEV